VVKQQVRDLSVQQDIQVLRGGTASEAFGPRSAALKSLREFMEAEKAVARGRVKVLYAVLVGLVLLLVAAGAVTGWMLARGSEERVRVLRGEMADARKEIQAVRRDAEGRWSQWETTAAGFQKALADAQAELASVRSQIASALEQTDPAAGAASPLLALLQDVQVLRSEQLHLDSRQTYLQAEVDRLEAGRQTRTTQRAALSRERDELARAVEDFAARQQKTEEQLRGLTPATPGAPDSQAVPRKAAPPASPGADQVVAVMDDIYRLRSEQLELRARQAFLLQQLEQVEEGDRLAVLQQKRIESVRDQWTQDVEAHLARQQEVQQRLDQLRSASAPNAAELVPGLMP
jgi:uncharacterized small protein (DUF1192 family)